MSKVIDVRLRNPTRHSAQKRMIDSTAKRLIVKAGRRSGKTVGFSIRAVKRFLTGRRQLYAAPTTEQTDTFWYEITRALAGPIQAGIFKKNESERFIELPSTKQRIKAKTAWNANTLRGDYADDLYLDEFQLMAEDTWDEVGAPMLLDNNGDAVIIFTPPSLHSSGVSKARDPRHASRLFKKAAEDKTGRWQTLYFTSYDNPYISQEALQDIIQDMSRLSYRQEILAEDIDEAVGALWTRELISQSRVTQYPTLVRVVVGVDPPGGATECGILTVGLGSNGQGYVLEDRTLRASPGIWAEAVLTAYNRNNADRVVGEANFGGDMVENTILQAAKSCNQFVSYKNVHASRGKAVRAEPVVAMYEQGRIHHVGEFPYLEEELCTWVPGESKESPNRMDALVWAITELLLQEPEKREKVVIYDAMAEFGLQNI